MDEHLDKIVDFILKYAPHYQDKNAIKEYVKKHFEYKTAFVMMDGDDICAVCRWNIVGEKNEIADILDLYIREDWRQKKIIQQMLSRGLWIFPTVKYLRFERRMKYPTKGKSLIPVEKILRRRQWAEEQK